MDSLQIVVADDVEELRTLLVRMVTRLGHRTIVASNGKELVELCNNHEVDLVISDIKMPEMGGFEAAACISDDVPVIFLTGFFEADWGERASEVGSYQILYKPVTEKTIASAIATAMSHEKNVGKVKQQIADVESDLENRRTIEQANSLLMQQLGITKAEAMRQLQGQARSSQIKLAEAAKKAISQVPSQR